MSALQRATMVGFSSRFFAVCPECITDGQLGASVPKTRALVLVQVLQTGPNHLIYCAGLTLDLFVAPVRAIFGREVLVHIGMHHIRWPRRENHDLRALPGLRLAAHSLHTASMAISSHLQPYSVTSHLSGTAVATSSGDSGVPLNAYDAPVGERAVSEVSRDRPGHPSSPSEHHMGLYSKFSCSQFILAVVWMDYDDFAKLPPSSQIPLPLPLSLPERP